MWSFIIYLSIQAEVWLGTFVDLQWQVFILTSTLRPDLASDLHPGGPCSNKQFMADNNLSKNGLE